tara:strand:+ start:44 stop:205 length:162 start_codon:yes stop_codon:yes gene_type:complete
MTQKKTTKKEVKQDGIEEFISLASDLKDIVLKLNQRMAEVEAVNDKIKQRLGL